MKYVSARDLDLTDLPESSPQFAWGLVDVQAVMTTRGIWVMCLSMAFIVAGIIFPQVSAWLPVVMMAAVSWFAASTLLVQARWDKHVDGALLAFAARNGWSYEREGLGGLSQSSLLWIADGDSAVKHGLRDKMSDWNVALWDHKVGRGTGRSRQEWRFTVVAVRFDNPVPHIVCDNRHNNQQNALEPFPTSFDREQDLKLEGDFPQAFKVYAPKDYERDALVFLTPDVMHAMMTTAVACDFELVDNVAYAYIPGALTPTKSKITEMLGIANMMQREFGKQNQSYKPAADVEPVAQFIEPSGRRLKQGSPFPYLAAGIIALSLWNVLSVFGGISPNTAVLLMLTPLLVAGSIVLGLWWRGR